MRIRRSQRARMESRHARDEMLFLIRIPASVLV